MRRLFLLAVMVSVLVTPAPARGTSLKFVERELQERLLKQKQELDDEVERAHEELLRVREETHRSSRISLGGKD
jgi:hypothetical protein